MFRLLCCSELGNLNKLFSNKKGKKSLSGVHFVRNYIFAGKVNFEGSLNDWKLGGCRAREGRGAERKRNRGWVGGVAGATRGALGVEEEKGGRQLLKAIALPPGCLRRAESVEMLNLA